MSESFVTHHAFRRSPSVAKLGAALAKAQGEIVNATKDSANPFFKSKYADLASIVDVIREPLARHGIAYTTIPIVNEHGAGVSLFITLADTDEWIEYPPLMMPVAKEDAQGIGSALTYSRRYIIAPAFCVATEDDDGNGAAASVKGNIDLRQKALAILHPAAKEGTESYRLAWGSMSNDMRKAVEKDHPVLKAQAVKVDSEREAELAPA